MNARLVNILINHAEEAYLQKSFDTAMQYTDQAMDLTNRLDHQAAISKILILKGKIQNSHGQYTQNDQLLEEAENYFLEAQKYTSPSNNAKILYHQGLLYLNKKQYELARKYFNDTLSIAESKSDLDMIIEAMCGISKVSMAEQKFKEAFDIAEQAFMLLDEETHLQTQVITFEQFFSTNIKMGEFHTIRGYTEKALMLTERSKDIEMKARILNSIAVGLATNAKYKEAFEKFMESKSYSEAIDFHENTTKCHSNMATILTSLSNYKEAYDNNHLIYSTPKLYNSLNEYNKGILLYNLGLISNFLKKNHEAISYLEKARFLGQETDNPRLIARSQYDLMRIYLDEGNYQKAIPLAKETMIFYDQIGDTVGSESHLANISEINLVQENYENAIKFGLKAVERSKKVQNYRTLKRSYKLLSKIHEKLDNYEKAYQYSVLVSETDEILYQEMRNRTMIDLERKYETSKKEKEIELLKSKMEIQSLELKHAKQISERNEKIAAAQEEMRQYTYAVSHDLKEPLRMIGSFSQLLHRKYKNTADTSDLEFFSYIHNGVHRMSALLNALLEYGRVGRYDDKKEWVNLKDLMVDIEATYYVKINDEKAQLIIDEMPMIYSNRLMLFQLLQNLVANGLKFKKPNTPPIVTVSYKELEETHQISVSDNGIGIADEHKERIFQIFARLHKRDSYEGTGIGLAMCKKIVNHLNGQIDVTSTVGKGTTFYITLPKADLSEINEVIQD